jgi:hypothetical protein
MKAPPANDWFAVNQRHLMAALGAVRQALEKHAARRSAGADAPPEPSAAAGAPAPEPVPEQAADDAESFAVPPALETLCAAFSLSPFERGVLLLAAGRELDAGFGACCVAAHGDPRRDYPTFSLALAALPGAHWSALAPSAPLRHWRLLDLEHGEALTTAPLRADERVLHFLTGLNYLDERLQGLVQRIAPETELPPSQFDIVRRIAETWTHEPQTGPRPVIQLCGDDVEGKRGVAAAACAVLGAQLHGLRAADLPAGAAEGETFVRLWEREAILSRSALLIDADDADEVEPARGLARFLDAAQGLVFVARREPLSGCRRPLLRFDVAKPTAREQRDLWAQALGEAAASFDGQMDRVAAQFSLSAATIRATSAELRPDPAGSDGAARLWELCRVQARPRLDALGQRLQPVVDWPDLVLPEEERRILHEVAAQVRQRFKVYDTWGFAAKGRRGLGISALFAGPSGTGKTMAAEVLAHELRLDLYRIDLSAVVSKYIGETEKNLRRIFDAAEDSGVILLFDEADALFGKRSEVKDSHDRYANIEVSYLLQRMEAYRGLAILTTNQRSALDPAFLRRIRFVVQFPFPDAAQRAEIWRRMFPAQTPVDGLNVARLAQLNVAGGNIRNIALNAAFLAADANEPVRMAHLLRAARTECAKIEKPLTAAETGGWV